MENTTPQKLILGGLLGCILAVAAFWIFGQGRFVEILKFEMSKKALAVKAADQFRQSEYGDQDLRRETRSSYDEDVYRFATGEVIRHGAGYPIQIDRPLDFAAVTDHAEYMGQARVVKPYVPTVRQSLSAILKEGSLWSITLAWLEKIQEHCTSVRKDVH